jgi:hypothetical protein
VSGPIMNIDRRRRPRVGLHYRVQLSRLSDRITVNAETENLSSTGFYCTSDEPFSPGESLDCGVLIPANGSRLGSEHLVLHRRVRVVRVEVRGLEPGFGVACEFEDKLTSAEAGLS